MEGRVQAHCEPATGCGPAGLGSAPAHRRPAEEPGRGGGRRGRWREEEQGWGRGGGTGRELVRGSYSKEEVKRRKMKEGDQEGRRGGARVGCLHPVGPPRWHCNTDSVILKYDLASQGWTGGLL